MRRIIIFGLLMLLAIAPASLHAEDDVAIRAMRDELARSIKDLHLENLERPYFIAYRLEERTDAKVSATFGSLLTSDETRGRTLIVEVRVGDYALDNTNFFSFDFGSAGVVHSFWGIVRVPLENDYQELRRQLWLATDSAYKKAVETLARKRAALQNKTRTEEIPDFSKEEPATSTEPAAPEEMDLGKANALVRQLSQVFKGMPAIFTSSVHLEASRLYTRYVNSEGTVFTRATPSVTLGVLARTQAVDGMPLSDSVIAYARTFDRLPKAEDLEIRNREMGARLEKLRTAPLVERYNGPVLFEGQAAAEVFNQVIVPRLLAVRRPVSDNPQFDMVLAQSENPFQNQLGTQVLPAFLSVIDDPTLKEYKQVPLAGGYSVDDDGVRARETRIVENGVLKTLLSTRSPVLDVPHSTGNRRGSGPMPSNLLIKVNNGFSDQEMRNRLLSLAKERGKNYAIVVRRIGGIFSLEPSELAASFIGMFSAGLGRQGAPAQRAVLAYKVFPDGREELVRNAELEGIDPASFKEIVAASKELTVYTTPFLPLTTSPFSFLASGFAGGQTSVPMVSLVVPSLLFTNVVVRPPSGEIPKPPVSKHPFFEK